MLQFDNYKDKSILKVEYSIFFIYIFISLFFLFLTFNVKEVFINKIENIIFMQLALFSFFINTFIESFSLTEKNITNDIILNYFLIFILFTTLLVKILGISNVSAITLGFLFLSLLIYPIIFFYQFLSEKDFYFYEYDVFFKMFLFFLISIFSV